MSIVCHSLKMLGQTIDAMKVLSRWTLAINTITTVQYCPALVSSPGFSDADLVQKVAKLS